MVQPDLLDPAFAEAAVVFDEKTRLARPTLEERALRSGPAALPDAEFLEQLISRSASADSRRLALILFSRFQTLERVLSADFEALRMLVPGAVALDIRMVAEASRRLTEAPLRQRPVISSWSALLAYVKGQMAHRTREVFHVLFLDKKNALILDEEMGRGTVDHAPVYPREIVRRALEVESSAVILVHNHPSGDPTPSAADIDMTKQVIDACKALKIAVHDHLIAGANGVASFKALGLI